MSREEQERQVTVWWNDYRFHLAMAIRTPAELNLFLGNTLSEEQMKILYDAKKKQILNHHLEIEVPDQIFDELLELINEGK